MDAAWPGVVVEESNLAVQISAIRRVLAQAPGGERWIETLARRGYRFVGPVTDVPGDSRQGAWSGNKRSNLPEPLTSFIGRERELVEIKRLLPGKRLLTLVGVGGIGKTRLALQVAAEVMDAYRDGVWLVEFGSISDSLLVATSVAQVLGVQERTGTPLTDTLCANLKARQLLLILDNCEHLLDACVTLVDTLLRGAAEPTIIATSREPLHVPGEQTYTLQSLSLPEPATDAEAVGRSEAVQLFIDRARQQLPDFQLTAARAPVVAELCIHLDGIPLALELAAARIRSLSIEQINARLNDRFKLLTGGTRTALPRQQTLRATLDWSFNLLREQERVVLRRLAIFAGGFALDAASAVASGEAIDEFAVVDPLSQLVARSLVVADTNEVGARYRLLETTRAYALEKLAEAGGTDPIQRRHAQYFRARFDRARDDALRMSDDAWRALYQPDLDNVRAALDWALGAGGDAAIGVALAGASSAMWAELSLYDEGAQRLEAALTLVGSDTPQVDLARLWKGLGTLWGDGRALEKAAAAHQRAADLFRKLDDPLRLGNALVSLGLVLARLRRLDEAASVLEQAFPQLELAGAPKVRGDYFKSLGSLKGYMGDPAAAQLHYERALSYYQKAGAERDVLLILNNLADVTWMRGDLDAALAASLDAVARLRKSSHARKVSVGFCLINLAGVHTERGELGEALAAAQKGLPLLKEFGMVSYPLDHLRCAQRLPAKLQTPRFSLVLSTGHTPQEKCRARPMRHVPRRAWRPCCARKSLPTNLSACSPKVPR
jgi:predicted ATPase